MSDAITFTGQQEKVTRKHFLRQGATQSARALAGVSGLYGLAGCTQSTEWRSTAYPGVILKNFALFDGIHNKLRRGLKVIIKGDKIHDIVREGEVSDYKNFKVIDLNGRVLMPGLIDNHVHITVPFMYSVNFNTIQQMDSQILLNFRNCVMSGVTTVRDVGGFPGKINKYRDLSDRNEIPGPRVISSLSPIAARRGDKLGAPEKAPYFKNPLIKWILGGNYAERPTTVAEIKKACEEMLGFGAKWLKTLHQEHSYSASGYQLPNHTDEGYRTILAIGRDHGVKSALHEPLLSGFIKGVNLGFDTLEHMPMDMPIPKKHIEKFNRNGMAIMPTIMIYGDVFKMVDILKLISRKGEQYLMPEAIRQISERLKKSLSYANRKLSGEKVPEISFDPVYARSQFPVVINNLKRLNKMGATIGAGSDIGGTTSGFFGRFTDELDHYIKSGISHFDTLRMATSINARIIDMHEKIGIVKKGCLADLIVVDGNPLEDIRALDRVSIVMKGGVFVLMKS